MSKMAIVPTLRELTVRWGKQKESATKRCIRARAVGAHREALDLTVRGQGQLARVSAA